MKWLPKNCRSVPALFGGKLDNQTCELQTTNQIELVMNEAAPLMAHVQVRGAYFKSYYDRRERDVHFSRRISISHNDEKGAGVVSFKHRLVKNAELTTTPALTSII